VEARDVQVDESALDYGARINAQSQWNAQACGELDGDKSTVEYFDRVAADRYRQQPWQHRYFDFQSFAGKRVLEIGIGQGTDLLQFANAGARCYGVDITDNHLALTRRNFELHGKKVELRKADATAIPFPEGFFDCVYSFGVLHHIPEIEAVMAEIRRVLAPNGRLMVALYYKYSAFHARKILMHGIGRGWLATKGYAGLLSTIEAGADGVRIKPYVRLYDKSSVRRLVTGFALEDLSIHQLHADHFPPLVATASRPILPVLEKHLGWYIAFKATKSAAAVAGPQGSEIRRPISDSHGSLASAGTGSVSTAVARAVIRIAQRTPFRGSVSYAGFGGNASGQSTQRFPQSEREAALVDDFFAFFRRSDVRELLHDKDVLDVGSGYGGRTAMYAQKYGARTVLGVEIFDNVVQTARQFAASKELRNVRFARVDAHEVGAADSSVDVVVSYDVLEHVADPRVTMREIHRALRPGGLALIVFTPYHGMLSHHLGYITRLPGIHWLFSPASLVEAINSILAAPDGAKFQTALQPRPEKSFNGRRTCLPTLNGLTSAEFGEMLSGFEVLELQQTPILERYKRLGRPGIVFNRALMAISDRARDAFSFNLSCILRKA
jgi:ubiquinone/menaquinone biosynthesis C-methylase UbiE